MSTGPQETEAAERAERWRERWAATVLAAEAAAARLHAVRTIAERHSSGPQARPVYDLAQEILAVLDAPEETL